MQKLIVLRTLPWLVGLLVFALALGVSNWLVKLDAEVHKKDLENVVQSRVDRMSTHFQRALDRNLIILDAIESLLLLNNNVQQREFEVLATRFLSTRTSIRQVQLSPNAIISQIYPPIDETVIGGNLRELPEQREVVLRTIEEKKMYLFGPVRLPQGGSGFIAHKPLFDREGLETKFWGFITVIIDADAFFDEISLLPQDNLARYRIVAKNIQSDQRQAIFGNHTVESTPELTAPIAIPGGSWQLEARVKPDINAHGVPHALLDLWGMLASLTFGALSAYTCVLMRKLYQRSVTDSLTGLYNRQHFKFRAEQEASRAERYNQPLTMLMIDIDQFKQINDKFGHQTGDTVLQQASQYIRDNLRESDLLGRYGGEEFIVLLPQSDLEQATQCADRIRDSLDKSIFIYGSLVSISVSVGLAQQSPDAFVYDELVSQADQALYTAKRNGRNRIEIYAAPEEGSPTSRPEDPHQA